MTDQPITITGLQMAEFGPFALPLIKDVVQKAMQERDGCEYAWRDCINRDAIVLERVEAPPAPRKPFARIDLYEGETVIRHAPGARNAMLGALSTLLSDAGRMVTAVRYDIAEAEDVQP